MTSTRMTAPVASSTPLTPFDLGQLAAEADIAAGRLPSQEALDKVAAIFAASLASRHVTGPAAQAAGAAA